MTPVAWRKENGGAGSATKPVTLRNEEEDGVEAGNDAVEEGTALMTLRWSDGAENDAVARNRLRWRRDLSPKT